MSSKPFPERIDPFQFFNSNGAISSSIPLARFQRFSHYLTDARGMVSVVLRFGRNEAGDRLLSGQVKATVAVLCQRCLEATRVSLASPLAVKIVGSDAATAADDSHEIVVCHAEEQELDLLAIVEDELILSLPIAPCHEDRQCSELLNGLRPHGHEREKQGQERPGGYAELAAAAGLQAAIET